MKLDCLFVHPNASNLIYQELSNEFSAIEPPIWAALLANGLRYKGFEVDILDCEANRLSTTDACDKIHEASPRLVAIVVYGQQPSASTQNMTGASALCKELKERYPDLKVILIGLHPSALPRLTIEQEPVDYVCQGEGLHTLDALLQARHLPDLQKVPGLWYREEGVIRNTSAAPIIDDLEIGLPGMAWDLLPMDKYRTSNWHSFTNNAISKPFASLYTSLGCPFKCFPKGTKVITSDCPNKSIQNVKVGDKLIGYDEKSGKLVETEVIRLVRNIETNYLIKIKFENGRTIKCTSEHPFYVHGQWIEAKDLVIGQEIHSMNCFDKISFNKHFYNPSFTEEARKRVSAWMKEAIKNGIMPNNFADKEWHENHPMFSKNKDEKINFCKKQSERMKEKNPMFVLETRKKNSNTNKRKIANGEIVPFMMRKEYWEKLKLSPNKMELFVANLFEEAFPGQLKFVGDGTFCLDYYSPDFVNLEKKKIIELHGCYWHKCAKCHPEFEGVDYKRDKDRVKTYTKHGFKTLEIWQHDLKDVQSLLKKVGDFLYNGLKIVKIERYNLRKSVDVYNFQCAPYDNYFVGLSRGSKDYILSHNCSFCCINAPFGKSSFRYWKPEFMIREFDKIAKMGIRNVKIADEMFVLNEHHFMRLSELIIQRGYNFNIWAYARVDTVKEKYLETLRKAGVRWLALGIESGNKAVRTDVVKGRFEDINIYDIVKKVKDHGIYVMGNFIFGLPEDTLETMQETLDLAVALKCDMVNMYSAMAYPGSKLYEMAVHEGWELPDSWLGYSQHAFETKPLPTKYISAADVLKFRDDAFHKYFSLPDVVNSFKVNFGDVAHDRIVSMSSTRLKRKLYKCVN